MPQNRDRPTTQKLALQQLPHEFPAEGNGSRLGLGVGLAHVLQLNFGWTYKVERQRQGKGRGGVSQFQKLKQGISRAEMPTGDLRIKGGHDVVGVFDLDFLIEARNLPVTVSN
jgi:hypothetical protein